MRIFIGADRRQMLASTVCRASIERRMKGRIQIDLLFLDLLPIKRVGLTEFTYTRYLVPWLCGYKGRALFMDGDMMARCDLLELEALCATVTGVAVVKSAHRYQWPSLMYFNCEACARLTPEYIERASPQSLDWAPSVTGLAPEWNHLVGYDAPNANAKIVHFTKGIPCWPQTEKGEFADEWRAERDAALHTVSWANLMGGSRHARVA